MTFIPQKETMLSYADKIIEITRPLKKLNITFFSYARVYKNGVKIDLNNSPDSAEMVYYKTNLFETYEPEINPACFQNSFVVNSKTFPENPMLQVLRDQFDIDHILVTMIARDHYYEVWNLGASVENHAIYDTYLNYIQELKKFRLHFRERAREAIIQFKRYPLISRGKKTTLTRQHFPPVMDLSSRRYILDDNTTISYREQECLYLLANGKSAKIIAEILHIGKRTVESHIEALKMRLHCRNTAELVFKASKEGLI